MNIYYVSDSSLNTFYTAVYCAIKHGGCITSDKDIQLALDDRITNIEFDGEKCEKVRQAVSACDKFAEEDIALALRSGNAKKEQIILDYIKRLLSIKAPIIKRLNFNEVVEFNDLLYKINGELHRLKGLLRFAECQNGILYAPFSPDNNIVDLLACHFRKRLSNEKFVIHDISRKLATIYDGKELVTGNVGEAEIYVAEQEKEFVNLWKKYYKSINIESRPHEKQMKGSMPVRYWKFLPEKQE